MPVIINDFEIITAPPPAPADQQQPMQDQKKEQSERIRPEDIERIQQRQQLRLARLRAN